MSDINRFHRTEMKISPKDFRKARTILGLTQKQAGIVLGNVSPGRIGYWERSPKDTLPKMKDLDSNTINQFILLAEILVDFFPDKADRVRFLQAPSRALSEKPLFEVLIKDPPNGLHEVVQFLTRLEHGIFT
jgi:hypothetical protein